jgi:hypothetical protein
MRDLKIEDDLAARAVNGNANRNKLFNHLSLTLQAHGGLQIIQPFTSHPAHSNIDEAIRHSRGLRPVRKPITAHLLIPFMYGKIDAEK